MVSNYIDSGWFALPLNSLLFYSAKPKNLSCLIKPSIFVRGNDNNFRILFAKDLL